MSPSARSPRPGSPGVLGYVIAVAVSLVVLGIELAVASTFGAFGWSTATGILLMVVVIGAVPAVVIGALGVLVVHWLTWDTASQVVHVLVATGVGFAAGALTVRSLGVGLLLGVATGVGRLAVVPLALRRRRRAGTPC